MSTVAGDINWRATGEGLGLQTAREVGRLHGVPVDVVLKGFHLPPGNDHLHSVEDHVAVGSRTEGTGDLIKFADYGLFMAALRPATQGQPHLIAPGTLTVVVMPYADLASCKKIDELSRAATPQLHDYSKIRIANRDLLLHKLRAAAALDDEVPRVRDLGRQIESLGRGLFPANKYPRWAGTWGRPNREIAMESLMKAHLDAKQYGDAHDLLLILDKGKHDAVFASYDPCRRPGNDSSPDSLAEKKKAVACRLEEYRRELEEKFGSAPLHPWHERADVLRMEARREFQRELLDARRQVIDIVETAGQELESIAEQLAAAGTQPTLLGLV